MVIGMRLCLCTKTDYINKSEIYLAMSSLSMQTELPHVANYQDYDVRIISQCQPQDKPF